MVWKYPRVAVEYIEKEQFILILIFTLYCVRCLRKATQRFASNGKRFASVFLVAMLFDINNLLDELKLLNKEKGSFIKIFNLI